MKKKFVFLALLMICLLSGTAYAKAGTASEKTETEILTEENRYDPVYYQEPEKLYPKAKARTARFTALSLEEYVVNALENFQDEINVSAYAIPVEDAGERYFQILNSHPSLFYVVGTVRYSYNPSTGTVNSYNVSYTDTKANISVQQAEFNKEVNRALKWVDASMTDVEKALTIHDYLALECEYDYDRLQSGALPAISHSAYGALVNKTAVCDGYSKAYSCILDNLGISNTIVSSDSMNHAWNMISIDGTWYHVDVTWDDPVRDCIGRVGHNYFLLSDTAISDSDHNHKGWSGGYTAGSGTYDSKFWSGVTSAFCYNNGSWYYSLYNKTTGKTALVKVTGHLSDVSESILYTEEGTWNNYLSGYMYLDLEPIKNEIYFNTRTGIYKLDKNNGKVEVYTPECSGSQLIFGFTVRGSQLCYALQTTPNITGKQAVSAYTVADLQLPQITGITVQNQETVYDGTAKQIKVEGTLPGDRITYKHKDGIYRLEQPEMKNAGIYQISYNVEREGFEAYSGNARMVIQKAKPVYTVPDGLRGSSGSLLSQVNLPQGFVWENASVTMREEGEIAGYVSYVPEDIQNYETVSHIPVKVTVSCPGHKYVEKVTVMPTATQKGEAVYTCELCGDSYTKVIDMVNPEKVSGLKMSKAATNSLKFSWKKVTGEKYRLILYKGKSAVTTAYTENSSYTFKKLKTATLYTVKVTSYVENNKTKIYASSTSSLKAATAPAKAKLVSVKKSGSTKVKITWKKVTGADGYEISMRTGKGRYKTVKTINKGKTVTLTRSGMKKGKSYSFRVRAYKKAGKSKSYGSYSNVKTIKMK